MLNRRRRSRHRRSWASSAVIVTRTGGSRCSPSWCRPRPTGEHAGDGAALAAASVWSGIAAEESRPRASNSRTMGAASPEALAGQFHAKGSGLPDYLPVCAATAGTIRSIHESPEATPSPPVAAAAAALPPPLPPRDQDRPRFTSAITLVTVPVTVTGRDGRAPAGPAAVGVSRLRGRRRAEGGAPRSGHRAVRLALLIDTSGSMREVREAVRASAPAFAAALRGRGPRDDRVARQTHPRAVGIHQGPVGASARARPDRSRRRHAPLRCPGVGRGRPAEPGATAARRSSCSRTASTRRAS